MDLQDVALLSSRAGLSTTFVKNWGRVKSLGTITCPKTVGGVSNDMLPVEYFCSDKASSLCQSKFHGYHRTVTKMRKISALAILLDLK